MAFDLVARLKLEDKMSDPLAKAMRQTDKAKAATDKASDSANKFEKALNNVGLTSKKVYDATEKLNNKVTSFAKTAAKTVAITTTAAAAGVTAFGVSATRDFMKFEDGMNEVFTLMPDITEDAMAKMSKSSLRLARDMAVLPEKVVPALYSAISAGVPEDNVFGFLETAQKIAKGGKAELETAVDGLSSVVNAYGTDVLDATKASDLMFTAIKLGKTDMSQLASSLFNVTPTAAALGVAFGDVTAAIASMTAAGTPTSVVTTQMRQLFVELSKSTAQASKIFEGLSGKTFKRFIAEGGNTQEALQILERGAAKAGLGINDLFSSVEAGSAALSLTGGGTEAFTKALRDMERSAGATEKAYRTATSGLSFYTDRLRARFAATKTEIGGSIEDSLINMMPDLEAAFDKVENHILTRYLNNPDFQELTLGGKINFVFNDLKDTYKQWYEEGGAQQITSVTDKLVKAMAELLEIAAPPMIDAGIKLGTSLAEGLITGLSEVMKDHPMLSGIVTGMATPGPLPVKAAAAIGTTSTAAILAAQDNANKRWEEAQRNAVVRFNEIVDSADTAGPLFAGGSISEVTDSRAWYHKALDSIANTEFGRKTGLDDLSDWANSKIKPDGSHAGGLSYVPYDGYSATLHRGERVLTAGQNDAYSAGGGNKAINVNISGNTFHVREESDIEKIANELAIRIGSTASVGGFAY